MRPALVCDACASSIRAASICTRSVPPFHANEHDAGKRDPADPPVIEEIVAVMRCAGDRAHGLRMRGLIVVL